MDFEGQKQAELLIYRLLILFAAAGFVGGYATGRFDVMVYVNAAGLAITLLAVVPDWPWFNRHPLKWLPALNPEGADGAAAASPGGSSSSAGAVAAAVAAAGGSSGGAAAATATPVQRRTSKQR
jgi:signal peptidase complex subunit 1